MNTQCPFCNSPAGQPCTTASGNKARQTHAARTQTTDEENAQMTIEYDFHAEAREEDGTVYVHLTEHPEQTYDPNALMVAETRDGGWEVFGSHKGTHVVSGDFKKIIRHGREVSPEFMEHAHAIPAARAGAEAIHAHNAVETAAHFIQQRPQDAEVIVSSLAIELGTDADGARKALGDHFQTGSTTGGEQAQPATLCMTCEFEFDEFDIQDGVCVDCEISDASEDEDRYSGLF